MVTLIFRVLTLDNLIKTSLESDWRCIIIKRILSRSKIVVKYIGKQW